MITTNLEFSKWPAFLGNDQAMSTVLADRLIHRSLELTAALGVASIA